MLDELDAAIEARETALDGRRWSRRCSASGNRRSSATPPVPLETEGLAAHYELDGSFSDVSGRYQHGRTIAGEPTFDAGQIGRAATFDGDTEVSFGNVGALRSRAIRSASRSGCAAAATCRWRCSRSSTTASGHGYEWRLRRRRAVRHPAMGGAADDHAGDRRARRRDPGPDARAAAARRLASRRVTYDGSGKAAGLRSTSTASRADVEVVRDTLDRLDRDRRAAARRRHGVRAAVRRPARRPAALQPRADAGADRAAGAALPRRARSSPASPASARKTKRRICASTS